jgi:hypothetical protein
MTLQLIIKGDRATATHAAAQRSLVWALLSGGLPQPDDCLFGFGEERPQAGQVRGLQVIAEAGPFLQRGRIDQGRAGWGRATR